MTDWEEAWQADVAAAQERITYEIAGHLLARVRYGDEAEDWTSGEGETCHDCDVALGQYHLVGCDVERCPACGAQALTCPCSYPADYPQQHKQRG